jgi:hypothetical protein
MDINARRLLQQVVESGIAGGIANASNLTAYKAQAVQKLQADYYYAPNIANNVVDLLIGLIKMQPPTQVQPPVRKPPIQQPAYQAPAQQQAPQIAQPIYQQVNVAAPQFQNQTNNVKLRHGFTSFWLWLFFIANIFGIILIIGIIVSWSDLEPLLSLLGPVNDTLIIVSGICCFAGSICIRQILNWKKCGFWGLVVIQIGSQFIVEAQIERIIGTVIILCITWGVLHFRNAFNAKTTWEQME